MPGHPRRCVANSGSQQPKSNRSKAIKRHPAPKLTPFKVCPKEPKWVYRIVPKGGMVFVQKIYFVSSIVKKSCVCKRKLVCVNKGCSLSLSFTRVSYEPWLCRSARRCAWTRFFVPTTQARVELSRGKRIPSEKRIPLTDILCHDFSLRSSEPIELRSSPSSFCIVRFV